MISDSIIDSRLWIPFSLESIHRNNHTFEKSGENEAHLATQLLLYDRIMIPTYDFGILPILLSWMGRPLFEGVLRAKAIAFIKVSKVIGYQSNGSGVSEFVFSDSDSKPFPWWLAAVFRSLEDSIELQIDNACSDYTKNDKNSLSDLIIENSREFNLEKEDFISKVRNEAYADVIQTPELHKYLLDHEPEGIREIRPEMLSGLDAKKTEMKVRFLDSNQIGNNIDLVLRVAGLNFEILLGQSIENSNLCTSMGSDKLLQQKLLRSGVSPELIEQFMCLLDLNNIPDFQSAIDKGEVGLADIWNIRQQRESEDFRKWLRNANPADSRELEKAFVAALGNKSLYSSLPSRILRFALTTGVGAVEPITGTLAGLTDSFFLEKWLEGYSPNLFLDKLRALPVGRE